MKSKADILPCPDGCLTCTEHLTRPCCVLLEVTQRCNLGCPVCYAASAAEEDDRGEKTAETTVVNADAVTFVVETEKRTMEDEAQKGMQTKAPSFDVDVPKALQTEDPSLETIAFWYERLYEQAGPCHIQLSGGEPTLRDDLDEIIKLGKARGFIYFQLNTNGLRLAEEPRLAKRLKEAGLTCVFLQFDGMDNAVHHAIRGKNLQATKEAAVAACAAAELPVVLVPTLIGGINEQELWPLVQYGIANSPTVRGVHIQPMAWFGRTDIAGSRLTNADVIDLLCKHSGGMLCSSHFSGGSAEHADCSLNAHYFITDTGGLEPSGVQRSACCGDEVGRAQEIQLRRWGTDLSNLTPERPPEGSMDEFLWQTRVRSFAITGMAFMDEETFDAERMQQCYLFILNPDGVAVPFCAYNMAHRGRGSLRSGSLKPELPKSESLKLESLKSEPLKPDSLKPKSCKLESIKSESLIPEPHTKEVESCDLEEAQHELAYSYGVKQNAHDTLSEQKLRTLQLERLNKTLAWARSSSSYYATRLPVEPLTSLDEISLLPLMDEHAFAGGMSSLLCLPQNEVSRIVTAATSGTTGEPKRIAFTKEEQVDIVEYLASGMRMLTQPGEVIAVLYPCDHAGGLGQLICEGVELADRHARAYGLLTKEQGFAGLAQTCIDNDIRALVGFPQHIYAFLNWSRYHNLTLPVQSVLLSADTVARSIKKQLRAVLGYKVFAHYGTTEMGYGGAVECSCATGQHIRETDLLFEVVDPIKGEAVPEGEWGELVFTTLNRKAMPLIRYRTGDMTRFIPGRCACGSILRRIDDVQGRVDEQRAFTMYDLEEIIFADPLILDFSAQWGRGSKLLNLELQRLPGSGVDLLALQSALSKYIGADVQLQCVETDEFDPLYAGKRVIKRVD